MRYPTLVLGVLVAACGGGVASTVPVEATATSPTSAASPSGSAASATPSATVGDLPFTIVFPDGWVHGGTQDIASILADLAKTDPEYAKKIEAITRNSPTFTSEFTAYNVGSSDRVTPNVGCNTLDRGDYSIADILDLGESQNREAVARLPGLIGTPTSDRMELPVGETVRVPWRWRQSTGTDLSSIGYLFVSGATVYTCVFSAETATVATHEPEWDAILRTFRATPAP
jgi:hypothetical protein